MIRKSSDIFWLGEPVFFRKFIEKNYVSNLLSNYSKKCGKHVENISVSNYDKLQRQEFFQCFETHKEILVITICQPRLGSLPLLSIEHKALYCANLLFDIFVITFYLNFKLSFI